MITIALSGHRRRLRWLVHGAALLAWAFVLAALLAAWVSQPRNPPVLGLTLGVLAGAALIWNACRKGAGRETLTVTPDHLVVRRAVGPFQLRRHFLLSRIGRIGIVRVATEGPDLYKVQLEYDGRRRRLGRNLTLAEASCIANVILRSTAGPHFSA